MECIDHKKIRWGYSTANISVNGRNMRTKQHPIAYYKGVVGTIDMSDLGHSSSNSPTAVSIKSFGHSVVHVSL